MADKAIARQGNQKHWQNRHDEDEGKPTLADEVAQMQAKAAGNTAPVPEEAVAA